MKAVKILMLFVIISLFLDAKWHSLDSLEYIKSSNNFNLKSGIEYIAIYRHSAYKFYADKKSQETTSHTVWLKMGKKPLKSFGDSAVVSFNKYRKIGKKDNALVIYNNSSKRAYSLTYYNAYMIDSSGKFWFLENRDDLIDMVKPIDTPQEAALIMWLSGYSSLNSNQYYYKRKYKESKSGYSVVESYQKEDKSYGGCISYKFLYNINRGGIITKRVKLEEKSILCGDELWKD